MNYIEAPGPLENLQRPLVFLAGGITNCENWQEIVVAELTGAGSPKGSILNPRRAEFPMDKPEAAREQVMWEQAALWLSDVISFWFAGGESVQPIVMFEFGCHLGRYSIGGGPHRIVAGIDPTYKRKRDVELQLEAHSRSLNGPYKIIPVDSLDAHVENIRRAVAR